MSGIFGGSISNGGLTAIPIQTMDPVTITNSVARTKFAEFSIASSFLSDQARYSINGPIGAITNGVGLLGSPILIDIEVNATPSCTVTLSNYPVNPAGNLNLHLFTDGYSLEIDPDFYSGSLGLRFLQFFNTIDFNAPPVLIQSQLNMTDVPFNKGDACTFSFFVTLPVADNSLTFFGGAGVTVASSVIF